VVGESHYGDEGDDLLIAGYDDVLYGGAGNDVLTGFNDFPFVGYGGDGNDRLGTGGVRCERTVCRGLRPTALYGEAGDDVLVPGIYAALLDGGDGNDRLERGERMVGGPGEDVLLGDVRGDELEGGPGADILRGGRSHDRLFGGDGNDDLDGGIGADYLDGGPEDGPPGDICDGGRDGPGVDTAVDCEQLVRIP